MSEPRNLTGLSAPTVLEGDWKTPVTDEEGNIRYRGQVFQFLAGKCQSLAATGNHTLAAADAGMIVVPNTGAKTLTLPAAASSKGVYYWVVKTTTNAVAITLDGNASETINGATTYAAIDAQYDNALVFCNGTAWFVLAATIA